MSNDSQTASKAVESLRKQALLAAQAGMHDAAASLNDAANYLEMHCYALMPEPALTYVVTVEFTDADGRRQRHETDGVNWPEAMYWIAAEADRAGLDAADRHEHEWTLSRDGRPVGYATVQPSNDRS